MILHLGSPPTTSLILKTYHMDPQYSFRITLLKSSSDWYPSYLRVGHCSVAVVPDISHIVWYHCTLLCIELLVPAIQTNTSFSPSSLTVYHANPFLHRFTSHSPDLRSQLRPCCSCRCPMCVHLDAAHSCWDSKWNACTSTFVHAWLEGQVSFLFFLA